MPLPLSCLPADARVTAELEDRLDISHVASRVSAGSASGQLAGPIAGLQRGSQQVDLFTTKPEQSSICAQVGGHESVVRWGCIHMSPALICCSRRHSRGHTIDLLQTAGSAEVPLTIKDWWRMLHAATPQSRFVLGIPHRLATVKIWRTGENSGVLLRIEPPLLCPGDVQSSAVPPLCNSAYPPSSVTLGCLAWTCSQLSTNLSQPLPLAITVNNKLAAAGKENVLRSSR